MPKIKTYLDKIKEALASAQQLAVLGDPEEALRKACSEYLRSKGYKVVAPDYRIYAKTPEDLVTYFYDKYSTVYNISGASPVYRNNIKRDLSTAKKFIASRMEASGVDRATAIRECADIITAVIEHHKEFGFKYALSFSIFGQDKLAWVTQKAVDIINNARIDSKEDERYCDMLSAKLDDECSHGFADLDDLINQTDEE